MKPRCLACRFFCRCSRSGDGDCHRFPPQGVTDGHGLSVSLSFRFAQVTANDWCGEFVPSDVAVEGGTGR